MAKIPFDRGAYANLLDRGIALVFQFPLASGKKASDYARTFDKIIAFRRGPRLSPGEDQTQSSLNAQFETLEARVKALEQRLNALSGDK
jgi:uncharacterized protein YceH (UPF0502 family)